MTSASQYPVHFEVERPGRFDRGHVLLRAVILIAVSLLVAFAWLVALIYVAVPVIAASLVSRDKERFREEGAQQLRRWVHTLAAADAYFTLLTDRFSFERPEEAVRLDIEMTGAPTPGSALMRLLTSIPSAFVLLLLSIAATVTGIVAGVIAFFCETYPEPLYRFHHGVVAWTARLLAYHASLVDEYPPFTLEMDDGPRERPSPPAEEPV